MDGPGTRPLLARSRRDHHATGPLGRPDGRGGYRYAALRGGEEIAEFYGSFHEVRPDTRLVQTFTYVGVPDVVSLEIIAFEDLGDGRTRTVSTSLVESVEARDMMMASGMETGIVEGFAKLDALLAAADRPPV